MTQFIEFEDAETGEVNYYPADEIGKVTATPDDAGDDTATVTIYDKSGHVLHTKAFIGDTDLAINDAKNYADSITDIIRYVIPLHPGFSLLTSSGPLYESVENKAPIVGMITGRHYSTRTRYFDILGNCLPACGHFAILNDATGEVLTDGWAANDEDMTFESVEKWLAHMAAHIRKLRAEMGIGEAGRVVHTEGNERAPVEKPKPADLDEEETADA